MSLADPTPITDVFFSYFASKKCFPISNLAGFNPLNGLVVRKKMLEIFFLPLPIIKSVQEVAKMRLHDNPEILDQH